MPLPPAADITDVPKLQFSHVECLMYAFHKLCKQTPEFLMKDSEQLKEFRLRLQYFARGIQGYIKKLREAISGKTEEELKSDENQLKVVALKTTNNINTLIKDLFHSPPSFKSVIHLSWITPSNDKKVTISFSAVFNFDPFYRNILTIFLCACCFKSHCAIRFRSRRTLLRRGTRRLHLETTVARTSA